MPILDYDINNLGKSGEAPVTISLYTNDTLAQILAPGYLNGLHAQGVPFSESDMALVTTKKSKNARSTEVGWFELAYDSGNWSLQATAQPGSVVLPVNGQRIAVFLDVTGQLGEGNGPIYHNGGIESIAIEGNHGYFAAHASPDNNGVLHLRAAPAGGDYNLYISNTTMTNDTAMTIPSMSNAAGRFLVAPGNAPFASGRFPIADGTTGLMKQSAGSIISGETVVWGGGGTSNNFVIAGMTAQHVGSCQIRSQSNNASIALATPSTGTLNVTFTADPGAATTLTYMYSSAPLVP